jgi:chromosome segregation ATPase
MASTTLTYDEFLSAVKKLEDEKKNVTYAAVRDILGRGSMATLRSFFAQYNEGKFSAKHAEIEISEGFLKAFRAEVAKMKLAEANLYKNQLNSLQAELEEHGAVVLQYETALLEKADEIEKLQAELGNLRREFASEQAKFSQVKDDARARVEELTRAVQEETDKKNKAEAESRVAQALQAQLELTTGELKEELDRTKVDLTQMTAKLEQQIERLTAKYETRIEKDNIEYKTEKYALTESHRASIQALQDQLAKLRDEAAVKDNDLQEQIGALKEREASANQKNAVFALELKYLKETNEELVVRLAGARKYFDKIRSKDSVAGIVD